MTESVHSSTEFEVPELANFKCQACGRCCYNWIIEVGPSARSKIEQKLKDNPHPEYGSKLQLTEVDDQQIIKMKDGHCPYLTESGLCWLHMELGSNVKPSPCLQTPVEEINTPLGKFVSLMYSCSEAANQLLGSEDKLTPQGTTSSPPGEELEPFKYSDEVAIDSETYLQLEKIAFGFLENPEKTLARRLGGLGKITVGLKADLKAAAPDNRDGLIQELKSETLPKLNTYTNEHLQLMQSFLDYRKQFIDVKNLGFARAAKQFFGLLDGLVSPEKSLPENARSFKHNLREHWTVSRKQIEPILLKLVKRLLWNKKFTYKRSFLGGLKIVSYIYALIRLYSTALAVENERPVEPWMVAEGISQVDRYFTHSGAVDHFWNKILDNPKFSYPWLIPALTAV